MANNQNPENMILESASTRRLERKLRLYEKLADKILELISAGIWKPSFRLQPERELSEAFGVNLVGAGNMTVETLPPLDHRVHRFQLVHNGITLVENMFLELLAAEKAYEFLLMIAPLRIYDATGSWVNPIAIT